MILPGLIGVISNPASVSTVTVTGGTITNITGYKVHTFTANGTLTVSGGDITVEYLVVSGGSGGAQFEGASNGGSGGHVSTGSTTVSAGSYAITVGGGGAPETAGSSSSIGAIVSALPGTGASYWQAGSVSPYTGGTPYYTPDNGNAFAISNGAGGAGAAQNGASATDAEADGAGVGGNGISSSITGTSIYYAGGAGGHWDRVDLLNEGFDGSGDASDGLGGGNTANRGGGGHGVASGGSGIVVVRYAA